MICWSIQFACYFITLNIKSCLYQTGSSYIQQRPDFFFSTTDFRHSASFFVHVNQGTVVYAISNSNYRHPPQLSHQFSVQPLPSNRFFSLGGSARDSKSILYWLFWLFWFALPPLFAHQGFAAKLRDKAWAQHDWTIKFKLISFESIAWKALLATTVVLLLKCCCSMVLSFKTASEKLAQYSWTITMVWRIMLQEFNPVISHKSSIPWRICWKWRWAVADVVRVESGLESVQRREQMLPGD